MKVSWPVRHKPRVTRVEDIIASVVADIEAVQSGINSTNLKSTIVEFYDHFRHLPNIIV